MRYRKQSNCVYACEYHIVISSKYRRKIFTKGIGTYLGKRLPEIRKHYPEIDILEYNFDKDHVHLLISIPPKMSVGSVVRIVKSNSARWLKEKFGEYLRKVYWGTKSVWSEGYFVSTIGRDEAIIRKYIENQGKEDEGRTLFEPH
jgi:putative transposase